MMINCKKLGFMNKEQAKQKIQHLVDRYNNLSLQEKKMNEETTKAKFIRPLFEALGWDFEEDVLLEDYVSSGRVDYNFRINGKTKFFLEAKPLKANIDDLDYARQATNYAWLKNVNWAVLSDFEGIRIFYPAERGQAKAFLRIDFKNYIDLLNDLWLLSKESFEQNLIEAQAEKWGIKPEQIKVSDQLSEDMNAWRLNLYKNFHTWNPKLSDTELDDGVQKILDRFIFIRSAEDRGLENNSLRSEYRIWEEKGRKGNFLAYLKPLFAEYKENYNSGLFDDHLCMEWEVASNDFAEIVNGLYVSKNGQEYDFSVIDADVLGSVYEQYLGHLLSKADDGDISKKKRKSQGIYYTPAYIVDHIVQNTLGKVLEEKTPQEIANLKILDPACGSGSFLIKAFDYLASYQVQKEENKKFDLKTKLGQLEKAFRNRNVVKELSTTDKIEILMNNIYGVDLDEQAVEIAQLNLMLKTLDRKQRLPHLSNIKRGNSLINDLKVAGRSAFNWDEEFPEIMKNGGFDVVIGNPPYVEARQIEQKYVNFYRDNYNSAGNRVNTFPLFLEKSINLLKNGGLLGMIVHKNSIRSNDYIKLRQFILNHCQILRIITLGAGVFEGVTGEMVILVFQKNNNFRKRQENIVFHGGKDSILKQNSYQKLPQKVFYEIPGNRFNVYLNEKKIKILEKIEIGSIKLKEIADTKQGIIVGNEKKYIKKMRESEKYKPVLRGRDISRYDIKFNDEYLFYVPGTKLLKRGKTPDLFEKNEKILTQHVSGKIVAALDCNKYYTLQTINLIFSKGKISNKYLLVLLNSKLINFYYDSYFNMGSEFTTAVATENLDLLPIKQIQEVQQQPFVKLADEILKLNKELQSVKKGTNRWNQLKSEILRTDNLIDQKVYRLYGLTPKEINIIESDKKL